MPGPLSSPLAITDVLQPVFNKLLAHPLYHHVQSVDRLRIFMREHAFAVWDFMSLLKRLQHTLCGTGFPWTPPEHPDLARFVNEIVLGEESDTNLHGGFTSHFDLYLAAMREVGADTGPVETLVSGVRRGENAIQILETLPIRPETKEFVRFNLQTAVGSAPWEVAAVFCYGREDVIPHMFERLLAPLKTANLGGAVFQYYLERHIELDSGEHGPLSQKLVTAMIGDNAERREAAIAAGTRAVELRCRLWDGILAAIHDVECGAA